jgi:predicted kinase
MPALILVAGLPGTGKSTVAEGLGQALGVPVFAKDWLEAALWRSGVGREQGSGWASYELLTTLAEGQLRLGQSAILDCVAGHATLRRQWRGLAERHAAAFRPIECVCSDVSLHQIRLTGRQRGIPGWYELDWADVERVRDGYEPWDMDRLVLEMAAPAPDNLAAALAYVKG